MIILTIEYMFKKKQSYALLLKLLKLVFKSNSIFVKTINTRKHVMQ